MGVRCPEAHQRRRPVHSCGRARRRAASAAERAGLLLRFARVSAAVGMRRQDYFRQGLRGWLRLHEKGDKRHDVRPTTGSSRPSRRTSTPPASTTRRRPCFRASTGPTG